MAKRTTRKQLVLQQRAEEFSREQRPSAPDCSEGDEYVIEVLNGIEREPAFFRFPLVPIDIGDPLLYCLSCCRCGCLRMPREMEGGFCLHCGHSYQSGDPEFSKTQQEHLAHCMPFQEYAHPGSRTLSARCGAPAPCSSNEQVDALDEALGRLFRVVDAVHYYHFVEKWALEGEAVDCFRQQALKFLSEYVQK